MAVWHYGLWSKQSGTGGVGGWTGYPLDCCALPTRVYAVLKEFQEHCIGQPPTPTNQKAKRKLYYSSIILIFHY